jgi:hypothetical protein
MRPRRPVSAERDRADGPGVLTGALRRHKVDLRPDRPADASEGSLAAAGAQIVGVSQANALRTLRARGG